MMLSLTVSMLSSSCSVSNRFLSLMSSLILFVWRLLLAASWSSLFSFQVYIQFDVAHNHSVVTSNVVLVDDCYIYDDVWPVC